MRKILLLLILLCTSALAETRYQTIEDILKLSDISSPRFSPSGKWILFTRHQTIPAAGTGYTTHYLYHPGTRSLKPLIIPNFNQISKIDWQPRQDQLLALMDGGMRKNVVRISPLQLSSQVLVSLPSSTQLVKMLPNESALTYTASYDCQPSIPGQRLYRAKPCNSLYRYDLVQKRHTKLVDGRFFIQNWDIAANGQIALEIVPEATLNRQLTDIALWDPRQKTLNWILNSRGLEMGPLWSPNSRYLAFLTSGEQDAWSSQYHLKVWDSLENKTLPVTSPEQGNIANLIWKNDSSGIYFSKSESVDKTIWLGDWTGRLSAVGSPNVMLDYFDLNPVNQNQIVTTLENMDEPEELYLSGKPITRFNQFNRTKTWGKSRVLQWTAQDGTPLDGILTLPPGYQPGNALPLLVVLHGGPADNFTRRFSGSRYAFPVQVLASQGYAVFRPNPRGSGNYGQKFSDAILKDWGGVDLQDVQSGVQFLIRQKIADPQRMAVSGWSYGGYLAALASAQLPLFKTCVVGAGITNLWSYIGQVDVDEFVESYLGSPELNPQLYLSRSPVSFAHQAKAPTLLIYGENDNRVPPSQGVEYFRALKRQGVETELWVIPGMGHRFAYASHYRQVTQQIIRWLNRYL